MRPFQPTRIVGGSVVAEAEPFLVHTSYAYRGADLATGAPVPVVVREANPHLRGDHFNAVFDLTVRDRVDLAGSPAPRVLAAYGRGGQLLATVEEHLEGVVLAGVLPVPVPVAAAIAHQLVPLWQVAESRSPPVALTVATSDVIVGPNGRVRVLPDLEVERSNMDGGAMALLADLHVAYEAPEHLRGEGSTPRSAMFTLGLLVYEMLVGAHPAAGSGRSAFAMLAELATRGLPSLAERRPDLPASVAGFVDRCAAWDPAARFEDWDAVLQALAEVRAALPPADLEEWLDRVWRPPAPIDPASCAGWERLPRSGWEPITPEWTGRVPASAPRGTPVGGIDRDLVYAGRDFRPMVRVGPLLVDARPVSAAEVERFLLATGHARPPELPPPDAQTVDMPACWLSWEDARAYADWAGKRLPEDREWDLAVGRWGAERLGTGVVWEWTATPAGRGHLVRGGRWRDGGGPAEPENRSFEVAPAGDVGFRCVADDP